MVYGNPGPYVKKTVRLWLEIGRRKQANAYHPVKNRSGALILSSIVRTTYIKFYQPWYMKSSSVYNNSLSIYFSIYLNPTGTTARHASVKTHLLGFLASRAGDDCCFVFGVLE